MRATAFLLCGYVTREIPCTWRRHSRTGRSFNLILATRVPILSRHFVEAADARLIWMLVHDASGRPPKRRRGASDEIK